MIKRRNWTKKGKKRKIQGQRRTGRVNIMGGLRYSDKKRVCFVIEKGDSITFFEPLKNLIQEIKKEGVAKGNNPEDFETLVPKIVIILDNASFHKKAEIIEKITTELPNIQLEYLPAYSPDYNLIELVWHTAKADKSAKEYIAHREARK